MLCSTVNCYMYILHTFDSVLLTLGKTRSNPVNEVYRPCSQQCPHLINVLTFLLLYLQGGCLEGVLDAFRFFFKQAGIGNRHNLRKGQQQITLLLSQCLCGYLLIMLASNRGGTSWPSTREFPTMSSISCYPRCEESALKPF